MKKKLDIKKLSQLYVRCEAELLKRGGIILFEMVYVILQIKSGAKVLKPWLGKRVCDDETLLNLYSAFASGSFDSSDCIASEYNSLKVCSVLFTLFHLLVFAIYSRTCILKAREVFVRERRFSASITVRKRAISLFSSTP